jgi:hypothetical protein
MLVIGGMSSAQLATNQRDFALELFGASQHLACFNAGFLGDLR